MRPKWARGGKGGSKWGENGREEGQGREKTMNGLLAHHFPCENGLLSTLLGKGWTTGWTKRPFLGGFGSQCEALRAFSTLLGPFWGLKPQNLLNPKIC